MKNYIIIVTAIEHPAPKSKVPWPIVIIKGVTSATCNENLISVLSQEYKTFCLNNEYNHVMAHYGEDEQCSFKEFIEEDDHASTFEVHYREVNINTTINLKD